MEIPAAVVTMNAIALAIAGLVGAYSAWQQKNISHIKINLELYERRIHVYNAIMDFLNNIKDWNPSSTDSHQNEKVQCLISGTKEARFLFDINIHLYIEELKQKICRLREISVCIAGYDEMQDLAAFAGERNALTLWLIAQISEAPRKFQKHLQIQTESRLPFGRI